MSDELYRYNENGRIQDDGCFVLHSNFDELRALYRTSISLWGEERKRVEREGLRVAALQARLDAAHAREDELAETLGNLVREEKKDDDDPNLYIARVNSENALRALLSPPVAAS